MFHKASPASPDAGACFQYIEILQDIRHTHQSHSSEEPQSYPGPVQVDGDKGGRDGEVVNEGIQLQHEPELVRGRDELKISTINKSSYLCFKEKSSR